MIHVLTDFIIGAGVRNAQRKWNLGLDTRLERSLAKQLFFVYQSNSLAGNCISIMLTMCFFSDYAFDMWNQSKVVRLKHQSQPKSPRWKEMQRVQSQTDYWNMTNLTMHKILKEKKTHSQHSFFSIGQRKSCANKTYDRFGHMIFNTVCAGVNDGRSSVSVVVFFSGAFRSSVCFNFWGFFYFSVCQCEEMFGWHSRQLEYLCAIGGKHIFKYIKAYKTNAPILWAKIYPTCAIIYLSFSFAIRIETVSGWNIRRKFYWKIYQNGCTH